MAFDGVYVPHIHCPFIYIGNISQPLNHKEWREIKSKKVREKISKQEKEEFQVEEHECVMVAI